MTTIEEIIAVLRRIRNDCKAQRDCDGCIYLNDANHCSLDDIPCSWDLSVAMKNLKKRNEGSEADEG